MSGFLRGHSCCTTLVKMVDDRRLALNSKKVTGSIAIDLSKAFDSICHNLLLAKLRAYGVGEEAIDFLHSYLSGRKQRMKVNGIFSDWPTGVLWRSSRQPHGPLLFNVFINDLNFSGQLSSLRLYADDTTAYSSNTDISALELSLNKDLENLSSWFASNYLSVNSRKTQATILGKHSHEPALHIGDSVIEIIGLLNILGVCIDDKLSFKDHLSTVLRNVYAKVGALRRLRKLVHADISLMLYMAYILPHLDNCSPLLNKKLESANYYALKALLNFGNSLDYDSILSTVNMQ